MSLALAGCLGADHHLVKESFDSDNTYSRRYLQPPALACEAARRTLLSQGYTVAHATADAVQGTKNFQPQDEVHEQLVLQVSCVPSEPEGCWVFVSAVQDRYTLKKSPTSASVGVGVFGSVSLPIGASDDSLVRVASVTVQETDFYQAFFNRLDQSLPRAPTAPTVDPRGGPEIAPPAETSPVAEPVPDLPRAH
jgi:hypothetical protein